MTGRVYTVIFKAVAVTAQQDFFEITAATGYPVVIHGWALSQSTSIGDAAEEMLQLVANRGVGATSGSGGTTPTGQQVYDTDTACSTVIDANNTTKMSAGTIEELETYTWNVRVPMVQWYTPETRPVVRGDARWTLELETTPVASITISGTVWFEEIG
jgi:hypothetical protein